MYGMSGISDRPFLLPSTPGDTDMGGKKPKNILSKGIFYGHIEPL
jgi:hypothetical protein